jgi:hypothetical protein
MLNAGLAAYQAVRGFQGDQADSEAAAAAKAAQQEQVQQGESPDKSPYYFPSEDGKYYLNEAGRRGYNEDGSDPTNEQVIAGGVTATPTKYGLGANPTSFRDTQYTPAEKRTAGLQARADFYTGDNRIGSADKAEKYSGMLEEAQDRAYTRSLQPLQKRSLELGVQRGEQDVAAGDRNAALQIRAGKAAVAQDVILAGRSALEAQLFGDDPDERRKALDTISAYHNKNDTFGGKSKSTVYTNADGQLMVRATDEKGKVSEQVADRAFIGNALNEYTQHQLSGTTTEALSSYMKHVEEKLDKEVTRGLKTREVAAKELEGERRAAQDKLEWGHIDATTGKLIPGLRERITRISAAARTYQTDRVSTAGTLPDGTPVQQNSASAGYFMTGTGKDGKPITVRLSPEQEKTVILSSRVSGDRPEPRATEGESLKSRTYYRGILESRPGFDKLPPEQQEQMIDELRGPLEVRGRPGLARAPGGAPSVSVDDQVASTLRADAQGRAQGLGVGRNAATVVEQMYARDPELADLNSELATIRATAFSGRLADPRARDNIIRLIETRKREIENEVYRTATQRPNTTTGSD